MSDSDLKILVLSDASSFHTERYLAQLRKQNCQTLLLSLEKGAIPYNQLKRKGPFNQLHYFLSVSQIKDAILQFQPDIISAHFASGYGYSAARANRKFKIPFIVNVWGSDILIVPKKSFLHRWKTKYALKHADYVIGDSHYLIDKASSIVQLKQTMVIPWGVEQEFLSLHKNNYQLSSPLKIIVSRPHEEVYNNLFIVEALAPLINKYKISITFPAFGSLYESFKETAHKIVGDKLNFYNKFLRPDFLKFLSEHDVYLSSSLSDSSPVSLIEAMALGLIPIAAKIEGVKEWLNDNSGFMFTQNDQQSLNNAISNLTDSNDNYEKMRKSNFERVKKEAIFEKNIARQIETMKELSQGENDGI